MLRRLKHTTTRFHNHVQIEGNAMLHSRLTRREDWDNKSGSFESVFDHSAQARVYLTIDDLIAALSDTIQVCRPRAPIFSIECTATSTKRFEDR